MLTGCSGLQNSMINGSDYFIRLTNSSNLFVRFRLEYYLGGKAFSKFSVGIKPGNIYTTTLPNGAMNINIIFFYYDSTAKQFIAFKILTYSDARNICFLCSGNIENLVITEVPCNLIGNPCTVPPCTPCPPNQPPTCPPGTFPICVPMCNSGISYSC